MRTAHDRGYRFFIEVSPHPVLTVGVEESLPDAAANDSVVVGSLRRDEGGLRRLLASVAEVHVAGGTIDLGTCLSDHDPRRIDLPTYAFQRKRFWMSPASGNGPPRSILFSPLRKTIPSMRGCGSPAGSRWPALAGRLSLAG